MSSLATGAAHAQVVPDSTAMKDSAAASDSSHKKHGLLGRFKKVASNKVVQNVTKVAACTVVPGGSLVAGAVDAATSKDASGAATGAAEAATGSTCSNTMGRLANGGVDRAVEQAVQPTAPAGPPQYDPRVQAQLNTLNGMGIATDEEAQAKCLGVSVEEYRLIVYPPGMNTRPPTKAEMKARHETMKKLDPRKQQECMMQASNQMMANVQQTEAGVQQRMAQANEHAVTEAPGGTIELPADLVRELASGKVDVRNVDWVAGSAELSAGGQPAFADAMNRLGTAMSQTQGSFRLDLYMDNRYDDGAVNTFGPQRLALVQKALTGAGVDAGRLKIGKAKRDKDTRLEVVRAK